ncbi:hypothetical protein D9M68_929830 [compost metagenome]
MAGLPSTSTRISPTVAWAAIGATSGSCGVQIRSTLAPAGTVTYASRANPAFRLSFSPFQTSGVATASPRA